jgi:hypothetical protein
MIFDSVENSASREMDGIGAGGERSVNIYIQKEKLMLIVKKTTITHSPVIRLR